MAYVRSFLLIAVLWIHAGLVSAEPVTWTALSTDLELTKVTVGPPALLSSELIAIRTSLRSLRPRVVQATLYGSRRLPVKELVQSSKALVAINANFFDDRGDALGLVVSGGNIYRKIHYGGQTLTGIFSIGRDGPQVANRDRFQLQGVLEAVQAGPRLLSQGRVISGLRDTEPSSRRSGLCLDGKNRLLLFVTSGLAGVSIQRLIQTLQLPEIGCVDALNLDGGGSTQMYVSESLTEKYPEMEEIDIQGRDPIPVMLGLFLKDSSPQTADGTLYYNRFKG